MKLAGVWNLRAAVLGPVLGLGLLASGPVVAGEQDFTLYNETGVDIYELYVSPASTDAWEEDVLGVDVLESGDSVDISFDRSEDADYWDLMVVDSEGSNIQWYRLKLTEISEVTLSIVGGEGVASVE
jgi:hypothetical protein